MEGKVGDETSLCENLERRLDINSPTGTSTRDKEEQKEEANENYSKLLQLVVSPEDKKAFAELRVENSDKSKERECLILLLKCKKGNQETAKEAARELAHRVREFGTSFVIDRFLSFFLNPIAGDSEILRMATIFNQVLLELKDFARPYTHKILVVFQPLIIDSNIETREVARNLIFALSRAVGFPTMVANLRPNFDHANAIVRNVSSRVLAVTAISLGLETVTPLLIAMVNSRTSWYSRQSGVITIHQIANLMGSGILPNLKLLIEAVRKSISDEQETIRYASAQAVAAIVEVTPRDRVNELEGIKELLLQRIQEEEQGKTRIAVLVAISFLILLLEGESLRQTINATVEACVSEFSNSHSEAQSLHLLRIVSRCAPAIEFGRMESEVLPEFLKRFWRQNIVDGSPRICQQLEQTTIDISIRVGSEKMMEALSDHLSDQESSEGIRDLLRGFIQRLGVSSYPNTLKKILEDDREKQTLKI